MNLLLHIWPQRLIYIKCHSITIAISFLHKNDDIFFLSSQQHLCSVMQKIFYLGDILILFYVTI